MSEEEQETTQYPEHARLRNGKDAGLQASGALHLAYNGIVLTILIIVLAFGP